MISRAAAPAAASGATAAPASVSRAKYRSAVARSGGSGTVRSVIAGHEAERALRADHQVREDLRRRCRGRGTRAGCSPSCSCAAPGADARGERGVGADLVAQGEEAAVQVGPVREQARVGVLGSGVDEGAVGQHEARARERVVAVLHDAAAHPRGVVGDDAAHHRGVDRRGIGAEAACEGRQQRGSGSRRRRLARAHQPARRPGLVGTKVRRQLHQDVVGQRLAGERRAGGAERQVTAGARARRRGAPRRRRRRAAARRLGASAGRSTRRRSAPGGRCCGRAPPRAPRTRRSSALLMVRA